MKELNKNYKTSSELFIKPDQLHTRNYVEGKIDTEVDTGLKDDMFDRLRIAMHQICLNLGMVTDEECRIKIKQEKKEMVKLFEDCRNMVLKN